MTNQHNHWMLTAVAVTALMLALPMGFSKPFTTDDDGNDVPNAANKAAAHGSDVEILSTDADGVTVLETYIKTSPGQDAVISVTLECSLLTDVVTHAVADDEGHGSGTGQASAKVVVWVEIDDQYLQVTDGSLSGDEDDLRGSKVTFCDRMHRQDVDFFSGASDPEDPDEFTIRQYQETMTANAFNWIALDLDQGVQHVVVKAVIETTDDSADGGTSTASGAVGKRTLVVDPVKFPVGTSIDDAE